MNLVRKYKIHKLTPCLDEKELEIITFIENKLNDLKLVKKNDYPESVFYVDSGGVTILEQDNKHDRLWVRYRYFWKVLEDKYLLNYHESQDIIRYMVLIHLKFRSSRPSIKTKQQ